MYVLKSINEFVNSKRHLHYISNYTHFTFLLLELEVCTSDVG
jgi:hypothetical protein